MAWFEPLIIIAVVSFVLGVIVLNFYLKKKGKSLGGDCGGNCANCKAQCSNCTKMYKEYKDMYSKN